MKLLKFFEEIGPCTEKRFDHLMSGVFILGRLQDSRSRFPAGLWGAFMSTTPDVHMLSESRAERHDNRRLTEPSLNDRVPSSDDIRFVERVTPQAAFETICFRTFAQTQRQC
ncbi:hypothetical protein PsYK624_110250 [Phanerochaete sordida]|uniref:Uncharacterized protein n=1 Tax=Phanerochaete sordida TaxID=48140 RepID=A0A9P3GJU2_9APHY|nr:hypothetical protein PsYK624_110250 [Phanerochaete sordida]